MEFERCRRRQTYFGQRLNRSLFRAVVERVARVPQIARKIERVFCSFPDHIEYLGKPIDRHSIDPNLA